ncbi:MAG: response regulator transcription factor [Eubacteriales bacterium]|nr:response regulator transcription factor [Eubacteriales bacterium]
MKRRILIVEDDENILQLEKDYLEAGNFLVDTATNGIEGLNKATDNKYDLLLLDIMLPGVDGLVICSEIRKTSNVPILLASAKGDDIDKIRGLGLGADDYIVKPFSPGELVARVIAHIKRYERLTATKEEVTDIISIGNVKIDKRSRQVTVDQNEVALTNKEFDLITVLAENPNRVFSKEELFDSIWKYDSMGCTSTVTVHVNRVRDKLHAIDPACPFINTIWGKGYRFNK